MTDYLALNNDFEGRREFVDGEIIEMPTESPQNLLISLFLLTQFLQLVPIEQLRRMDTELLVASRVMK
ncbi:Uma2 family endonuclease [Trichothermofontia sichuanensis B231]|uniref:Uma2 family endonuclease n=1 Tax=Trichothermofontia sichuanensis TaxID=3045816 RepID=UPI0022475B99|nr:Uma2 family endonuclease [Trichothermofontia sichuanensis]UZQ53156.1 Uma2 family endonuclease [Trichothermofontia sichuanensis B231]